MSTEFPSNSKTPKVDPSPEPKDIQKVVSAEVIQRKRPLGKRFLDSIVGGDANTAKQYVLHDVVIPAIRDMVADSISQGVERMIFGEVKSTSRRGRSGKSGSGPYINYSRLSSNKRDPSSREPELSRRARASHDFGEIVLTERAEATEVIDRLFDLVSKYEAATVSDLYDLVGVTGTYMDDKWGWTDLRGANVRRVRDGYLLELPRTEPLN